MIKNFYFLMVMFFSPFFLLAQSDIAITINGSEISSGSTIDLGTITLGTSLPNVLYIENAGDASLTLDVSSAFAFSGTDASLFTSDAMLNGESIDAGGFTVVDFTIEPETIGSKSGTITINSDDADESAFAVNLTMNVVSMAACSGGSLDFETSYLGGLTLMEAFLSQDPLGVTYYEAPTGWSPANSLLGAVLSAKEVNISITADARSGAGALQLVSDEDGYADVITVIPCADYPESISGYYKYSGDAYQGFIILSTSDDENRTSGNTDTLYIEDEESSYTFFEMSIPYDAQSVNTLTIHLVTSQGVSGATTFILDDLSIVQGAGGVGAPFTPSPVVISNLSSSSFDVSWEEPNDHGSPITSYSLEEKIGAGSFVEVYSGTALSYSKISATIDVEHTYRLKATNAEGVSPYSSEVVALPNDNVTMNSSEVTRCDFTFTDSGGTVGNYSDNEDFVLTFTPETEGDLIKVSFSSFSVALGFDNLYVYDGPDKNSPYIGTLTGTTLPADIIATSETGQLTFWFDSNFTENEAGWVAEVTCITPQAGPPSQPDMVTFTNLSVTSVTVNWEAPGNNGSAITGYTLQEKEGVAGSYSTVYNGTDLSYEATSLTEGETYYYKVLATNANGDSDYSNEASIVPENRLNMSNTTVSACDVSFYDAGGLEGDYSNNEDFTLTVEPENIGDYVSISFSSFNLESGYDYLKIYDGPSASFPELASLTGTSIPPNVTATGSGGELTFVFTSDESAVRTGWVAYISCITPTPGPPSKPNMAPFTNLSSTSLTVNWLEPGNNGSAITGYTLQEKEGVAGSYSTVYNGTDLSYEATSLTEGETYYYKVLATNANGDSDYSNEASIVPENRLNMSNTTVSTCDVSFYDAGGPEGNYSDNEDLVLTVEPATLGGKVKVSFSAFNLESDYDELSVYDGASTSATLLATLSGSSVPSDYMATTTGGELTFHFESDGSVNQPGWVATLSCVLNSTTWDGESWNNGIPDDEKVTIMNGDYSDTGFTCANLIVTTGNTLTVNGTLDVNGELTNNGTLEVESGSSLITYDGNTISGNDITFKRNTRYADGKYSFVGSPVQQDGSIVGSDLGSSVYSYIETTAYGADGINRWEDASADELISGKGYTQAFQQEIVFNGMPNMGTITIDGSYTEDSNDDYEGWVLVSNPYPTAIDVAGFLGANTNTSGAIYIWDDNGSNIQRGTNADYIVANGTMATNTTPAGGQTRYNQTMGSMQGFFVKLNNAADVQVEFREDMRVTANSDANFFRETAIPIARINLTDYNGLFKQTVIGLAEDAIDNELNRTYDAQAFNASSEDGLFTMKAGRSLSLNGMTNDWEVIQLQVNTGNAGIYEISVDLEDYNQSLYLKDNETGDVIDLKNENYTFSASAGIDTDRFQLLSSPMNVLGLNENEVLVYAYDKMLHIQSSDDSVREYFLFDMNGRQILSTSVKSKSEINLSAIPAGIYLVFDGIKTHKIILK